MHKTDDLFFWQPRRMGFFILPFTLSVGAISNNKEVNRVIMLTLWMKQLLKKEDGQGLVEYGLIIALVALVVVAALTLIGGNLTNKFNEIASSL